MGLIANTVQNDRQLRELFAPHGRGFVLGAMAIVWTSRIGIAAGALLLAIQVV